MMENFLIFALGILTLEIDGKVYKFTYDYSTRRREQPGENWNPSFWRSGGSVIADADWNFDVSEDEWEYSSFCEKDFPEELLDKIPELLEVFNENVPYGCCGGCI